MTKLAPVLVSLVLSGCTTQAFESALPDDDRPSRGLPTPQVDDLPEVESPMVPLVADMCDEPTFAGVAWETAASAHFTLSYLPGTAADEQQAQIAERLEAAYTRIRDGLGITAEPQLVVNLSPSRNAARAHNLGYGRAWPYAGRYDVIYTGAYDSYENRRYGKLLTSMLDYHLDANNRYRHPLLTVGVAEYFDQSGRDLHVAYARQLAAGTESRVRIAELDDKDVIGANVGRAGSLVKFLVDRYGLETFVDIYKQTAVAWNSSYGCYWHPAHGCVATPQLVTSMIDQVLVSTVGETWTDIQPLWEASIEAAFDRMPVGMAPLPTVEIQNVLRVMDDAINTKNAAQYRSTMEGFYCDWGGDAMRGEIATRAVNAYAGTHSELLGLFDTDIKNFWTAQALVMRTDELGIPTFQTITLEHVPAGWRIAYSPDWR